jgi:hypothetical protein
MVRELSTGRAPRATTGGHRHDSIAFEQVMSAIRSPRAAGRGQPAALAGLDRIDDYLTSELAVSGRARIEQPGVPPLIWRVSQLQPGRWFFWSARSAGMSTIAGHDLRGRDDGTVTVAVSVEQTGMFSCLVGVLFGGRTRGCPDVDANALNRGGEQP